MNRQFFMHTRQTPAQWQALKMRPTQFNSNKNRPTRKAR
jgi:hypothetical protein